MQDMYPGNGFTPESPVSSSAFQVMMGQMEAEDSQDLKRQVEEMHKQMQQLRMDFFMENYRLKMDLEKFAFFFQTVYAQQQFIAGQPQQSDGWFGDAVKKSLPSLICAGLPLILGKR